MRICQRRTSPMPMSPAPISIMPTWTGQYSGAPAASAKPPGWTGRSTARPSSNRPVPLRILAYMLAALALPAPAAVAQTTADRVDTALVLAVDVSGSVDAERYALQMEGIASAFEDSEVQRAIFSGPHGALLVILVNWSHKPEVAIPWTIIANPGEAAMFAAKVRAAHRAADDFTCMSTMLELVA